MNTLKAAFWDYPEFMEEVTLRSCLQNKKGTPLYYWLMSRFLEYARVVDTFQFFSVEEIAHQLPGLKLRPYTRKKWDRMVEIYGNPSGK